MVKFGTSGLRGLARDLTDPVCAAYTLAFLETEEAPGTVLLGRDLRASSPRISTAVAAAAHAKARVLDCGVLPTPALALEAMRLGAAAIMVTGSHIPADRNGLKFYTSAGEIAKEDEAAILSRLKTSAPDLPPFSATAHPEATDRFLSRYRDFFGPGALAGLRLGVYQHSSAARDILPALLESLGAEVVLLGRATGFVAIDTEAVAPEVQIELGRWAAEHALDAILSTDGDADRPLLTDATGRQIAGDILGPLTARWLGATALATPVSSNTGVDRIEGIGRILRTQIGSPYVIAAMKTLLDNGEAAPIGYEPNGGFLLGYAAYVGGRTLPPLMTRDSILPMLAPLVAARAAGQSLADLVRTLPARAKAAGRIADVQPKASARITAAALTGDLSSLNLPPSLRPGIIADINTTDGARLTFADGTILHLRPSGNAPEMRCYTEAETQERAEALLDACLDGLRHSLKRT